MILASCGTVLLRALSSRESFVAGRVGCSGLSGSSVVFSSYRAYGLESRFLGTTIANVMSFF